ncbi:MAG: hypothetical protein U5K71_13730 [Gracilimonas sp.]|nr:hypothetical protein [Gracilimonas sp.]
MEFGSGSVSVFSISLLMVTAALLILIYTIRKGHVRDLGRDAMIPFEEDEPVGEPTDQLFNEEDPGKKNV